MFNSKFFTSLNGQLFGSSSIKDWKYVTCDTTAEVSCADYFKAVQALLNIGDIIHVYYVSKDEYGNAVPFVTGSATFVVRMSDSTGGHVAVLPKHDLNGQCVLMNGNVGDTTSIIMSTGHTVTEAYCILSGGVDSDGDESTITVSNGDTVLFSTSINSTTADGSIIKMTKSGTASEEQFSGESFEVINDGGVARAHGTISVVLNATKK